MNAVQFAETTVVGGVTHRRAVSGGLSRSIQEGPTDDKTGWKEEKQKQKEEAMIHVGMQSTTNIDAVLCDEVCTE